jgi:predicted component of type VI protein secretion system
MAEMSDRDWEALHENFATAELLTAVDSLDALRGHLNDREHFQPPEIRHELLKLHGLAMKVVGTGARGGATEMFDLAEDLEEQFARMMEEMEQIADTLGKLTSLRPKSLDDA